MNHEAGHGAAWWDGEAAAYGRRHDQLEPALSRVTDALLDAVRAAQGQRLLDLGCGPGHVTEAARLRGAQAVGLDLSPAMVFAARRRFPAASFVVGDMDDPPSGPWDAVVSRFAGHHAGGSWIEAAHHVLLPGGRIAIAEVIPETGAPEHSGKVQPAAWRRRLEAAGFDEVAVARCAVPPVAAMDGHAGAWPETWIIGGRRP